MSLGVIEWSRVALDRHVTARGSTWDAPRGRRSYELTSPLTTSKTRGYDYLNAIRDTPDILDAHGQPDRLRLPLYDVLMGDAEAIWALLIGYLRLLGAAYADVVECIADGAEWIGKRVERLSTLAEIPAAKVVEVLDFSHASH